MFAKWQQAKEIILTQLSCEIYHSQLFYLVGKKLTISAIEKNRLCFNYFLSFLQWFQLWLHIEITCKLFKHTHASVLFLVAPHSSTLAWKIPWTEEAVRLQSMGSLRVGHDWATSLSLFTFMHWRRKWQPTPVFLPGESQGRGSLVGCRLWGHTESDTTEVT